MYFWNNNIFKLQIVVFLSKKTNFIFLDNLYAQPNEKLASELYENFSKLSVSFSSQITASCSEDEIQILFFRLFVEWSKEMSQLSHVNSDITLVNVLNEWKLIILLQKAHLSLFQNLQKALEIPKLLLLFDSFISYDFKIVSFLKQ